MAHDDPTTPLGPSASELLARATHHADAFVPVARRARVAVVVCMDNRIHPAALLGLDDGDAYIIRNAGGILTDDVRRSLAVAQHALGVKEIILIHHTNCGMEGLEDQAFASQLADTAGIRPTWRPGGFASAEADVREMLAALASDPHIPAGERARGFVYNLTTGRLNEVSR
ncbi:beta-class carbonic anhydrase [Actinomyces faecalis]|uniref:beta-class carbonic anhydrase n=1 Tax=Actinomyces faecalis TaxID=2722820 RepID=UPI001555A2BC|nr:carbonic anhydrase [Actinomyces faecalis]